MEYDDLIKIRALIKTAYKGSWNKSLFSDYDIMFQSLQCIETIVDDEIAYLEMESIC